MVADPVGQWALTLLFTVLAAYLLFRVVVDRVRPLQWVGHLLHAVMAADMVAMAWPWWGDVPTMPQVMFFAIAAGWFAMMLFLQVSRRVLPRRLGGHDPWHQALHVGMMLAMVWMVAVMAGADPVGSGGHDHMMSTTAALTGVVTAATLIVAGSILVAEFLTCVRGGRRTWWGHTGDLASGSLMSLGMAAMCWFMLAG